MKKEQRRFNTEKVYPFSPPNWILTDLYSNLKQEVMGELKHHKAHIRIKIRHAELK